MQAVLWDGNKQITGTIKFNDENLEFLLDDFADTNLSFQIKYSNILDMKKTRIYKLAKGAITLTLISGQTNVFILADADRFFQIVNSKLNT